MLPANTVTGTTDRSPAHAERPVGFRWWPWLLAALTIAAAAAGMLQVAGDPVPSVPPSARTITATSAPPS